MLRNMLAAVFILAVLGLTERLPASNLNDVQAYITAWRQAWRSKDIESYMSFYSPAFRSGEFDHQGWLRKKARLFRRPGAISLEITDLKISIEGSYGIVRFVQRYRDPYLTDVAEKTVILEKSEGMYKIVSEERKPLGKHRTAALTTQVINKGNRNVGMEGQHQELNHFAGDKTVVKSIKFQPGDEGKEKVLVHLSGSSIPDVYVPEGITPFHCQDTGSSSLYE